MNAERALTAPPGVDLTGVWSIDRERSDDPAKTRKPPPKDAKDGFHVRAGGGIGGLSGFGGLGSAATPGPRPSLAPASERIEILQLPESVDLKLEDYYVSCTSTANEPVSLPDGLGGERTCGWEGSEFVVEIRDSKGFIRTDRYSGAGDDTLVVRTTVKGERRPKLEFRSVYGRSERD